MARLAIEVPVLPTTTCDSPITLVNATFQWLADHVKDDIDFIIWTGDSARHDNDERKPRTETQILDLNRLLVSKFAEVFGKEDKINDTDPTNDFRIPIIPNFGNNDVLPHNIMTPGPNHWTKDYSKIWRPFIPEAQRHSFDRGGWFFVEVIPHKLVVFSLNTLYFFSSNAAVDGCAKRGEPGYEQMDWLRIQLQFLRERGVKAIMMGHVPPAKTDSKESWDKTCWQKYTLWMESYRDVVVGGLYGHMNIEHFMLQDFHHVKKKTRKGKLKSVEKSDTYVEEDGDDFSVESKTEYLTDLREEWRKIPDEPKVSEESEDDVGTFPSFMQRVLRKKHDSKTDKYLKKIGGRWAERYSVSLVSASVVPNYFPTMRIIEYNTTGLELHPSTEYAASINEPAEAELDDDSDASDGEDDQPSLTKHKKKHKKRPKKKKPTFVLPSPPPSSSTPGPAYSPQPLTWLSYKQYFANLTRINPPPPSTQQHLGPATKKEYKPVPFEFELEYDTATDPVYKMPDLTVRSWVGLARQIGKYKPRPTYFTDTGEIVRQECSSEDDGFDGAVEHGVTTAESKKKEKHRRRKEIEKLWFTFISRAYVGTKAREEIEDEYA
ncbi:uncharacterized protein KY384_002278 [Bacidia gigantensis]|uniref:uncharacterized protein n=1 Tax=Bacidia gigantensis TaxID=2732470 RepID=UPI001D0464F4|nr:uncharacterized protein KY384_002278 [Bacidia gigantensis]KAG8533493.1 hypothetical protein KY384_002278 [Bacidia gigantensis]